MEEWKARPQGSERDEGPRGGQRDAPHRGGQGGGSVAESWIQHTASRAEGKGEIFALWEDKRSLHKISAGIPCLISGALFGNPV